MGLLLTVGSYFLEVFVPTKVRLASTGEALSIGLTITDIRCVPPSENLPLAILYREEWTSFFYVNLV